MRGNIRKTLLSTLGLMTALATPAMAEEREVPEAPDLPKIAITADYEFFVGGMSIADVSLGAQVDRETYIAESTVSTRGFLDFLIRGRVSSMAEGLRGPFGSLAPQDFRTDYSLRSGAQTMRIGYAGLTPEKVEYDPPEPLEPYHLKASPDHRGTLDPLTAAVMALTPANGADLCNRTIPVFDGKRRYDIIFVAPEPGRFDDQSPPPEWKGPLTRCLGVYERIAGFEPSKGEGGRYFPFDIWFEDTGKGVHRAVRLAGKTKLGYAIGNLRRDDD